MKIGVIGAGVMGSNHARVAAQSLAYELSHVFDSDRSRAEDISRQFSCDAARSIEELIEAADAVIIATPTATHASLIKQCFDYSRPFLVEKPIVTQVSEVDEEIINNQSLIMVVGHVERFNPAIRYLKQLKPDRVNALSARREGPYSNRISEGVTRDLMIHDIDLAGYILGESMMVQGSSWSANKSKTEDVSSAVLQSESGAVVSLFANRIGQTKVRDIRIVTDEYLAVLDLLQRSVVLYKQGTSEFIGSDSPIYSEQLTVETPMLSNYPEPLAAEQHAFVNSIRNGELDPELATLQHGLSALQIANEICS